MKVSKSGKNTESPGDSNKEKSSPTLQLKQKSFVEKVIISFFIVKLVP